MIASVSGSRIETVVPSPGALSTAMVPRRSSTLRRTTSIPTPRPERSVTSGAVENPGWKISALRSASRRRLVSIPRSAAAWRMPARSSPAPSSATSMTMLPASRRARSVSRPAGGLPAAARRSGGSMP